MLVGHTDSSTLLGKLNFPVLSYNLRAQPVFIIPYHHRVKYGSLTLLVHMMKTSNDINSDLFFHDIPNTFFPHENFNFNRYFYFSLLRDIFKN